MANVVRAEKVERRRAEILDAAMDVFSVKGFHQAAIADIAWHLNIGHGTIYRYYKNKREIFDAISILGVSKIVKVVSSNPPNADSMEEYLQQLKNISTGLSAVFIDDPRYVKIVLEQTYAVNPKVKGQLKKAVALVTKAYLKNGVDKCFLRESMNQTVASYMVTAMMFEIVEQIAEDDFDITLDDWNQELLAIMLGGISL